MLQGLFFKPNFHSWQVQSIRSLVERLDVPKVKMKVHGMKLFQLIILLIVPLLFGCSETNPLKWRPMDLAPAALLENRKDMSVSSSGHFRGGEDNEVTGELHGVLPQS